MKSKTESESMERTLQRLERPWQEAAHHDSCRLLRLSLLRELVRAIHTLRSEVMATQQGESADDLAHRENYLNSNFRLLELSNLALSQAYSQTSRAAKPVARPLETVSLPKAVTDAVGNNKFTRQDRKWELELAQEAVRLQWEFWQFEASTEIHEVESFARSFSEKLWPHGVVLFVESDGFLKMSDENSNLAFWRGRWLVVMEPHSSRPGKLGLVPTWQRLYP
jgi:hypothetical protein